ncbi:MAG TPA: hypothetical protein VHC97_05560 [Thermoanaerobaculia bacterium]|jgi:hypothetical protein|nr:hypothetical protein [Thermoanaerobaculia bacterium]
MANRTLSSLFRLIALLVLTAFPAAAQAPGGFLEKATSTAVRPRLTPAQIQSFLPARGAFTFPAPYNTRGIRLTNASDCGGTDCVNYVGYSYWRNINNHAGGSDLYVFLGLSGAGGTGPTLFRVNKATGAVTNLGPLFDPASPFYYASAEGWYWSASQPSKIYVTDNFGPRLYRYDAFTHQFTQVFDVSAQFGSDKYIWQAHSSDDDRVHSVTLRDKNTYEMLGCLVYREDTARFSWFPKVGDFDECHVDKSGRWLVSFEDLDGLYGLENRIIDLQTMTERRIFDQDGAAGHMDTGFGYMAGQDNWNSLPNAVRLYRFDQTPIAGPVVYHDSDWSALSANHVAHGNAKPGVPLSQQFACGSGATRNNVPRGNELVCFKLDTSLDVLVVAPTMIDLDAPGGGDDYGKSPKANLDVTGRYMIWTSNLGGNRLDAFLVEVPYELLTGGTAGGGGSVVWTSLVNATASGGSLQKSGGCDGCDDAGAVSQQQIASGNGAVLFTATETDKLRYVGLSHGNTDTRAGDIDFAIRLGSGYAEVRENNVYRADTPLASGDRFKVAVEGGVVKYYKNGVLFYTSTVAPTYPLLVDASLLSAGSTVTNATIE